MPLLFSLRTKEVSSVRLAGVNHQDGRLQPQTEAVATGSAPKEAVQALGTDLAEASGLGSYSPVTKITATVKPDQ